MIIIITACIAAVIYVVMYVINVIYLAVSISCCTVVELEHHVI